MTSGQFSQTPNGVTDEKRSNLTLATEVYCFPGVDDPDDPLLPEGTPIRDLCRGEDHGALGVAWRLQASLDGGVTWRAFETMWNDEELFPVSFDRQSVWGGWL